jgi:hypothetical protein
VVSFLDELKIEKNQDLVLSQDRGDREQFPRVLTRPIFLSRNLEAVFSDSSDELVLCLWSLPVDDYIQHPDCEPESIGAVTPEPKTQDKTQHLKFPREVTSSQDFLIYRPHLQTLQMFDF